MRLTISAYSAALFSTWYFVEELGLLFDAGDRVVAGLTQRSRKVRHVFITHADRDHVTGLVQLHQLNAGNSVPNICHPKDCGSFAALRDFLARFDPDSGPATWTPLEAGQKVPLDGGRWVLAEASDHITGMEGQCKALRYTVCHSRRVLRSEFQHLNGQEIARLRKEKGQDAVTEEAVDAILGYSGDASGLDADAWRGVQVLIHECTFLEPDTARRAHSSLPQVLAAARALPLKALILDHFSTRYSHHDIEGAIRETAAGLGISFPIYAVLPGVNVTDLLGREPVWNPS